jgi:hypothetical protein
MRGVVTQSGAESRRDFGRASADVSKTNRVIKSALPRMSALPGGKKRIGGLIISESFMA